jgi:ribosome biogenesis GTPase A
MARARRLLEEQLKRVDAIIELCDARLPFSSRNPDLARMAQHKRRLLVMNKADLADDAASRRWAAAFAQEGLSAFAYNAARGRAQDAVRQIDLLTRDLVERQAARGVRKTVRAMVVGVPNVGKSTFINRLNGTPVAITGDRPGVTRAVRWVRVAPYLELMDTPGLLWPRLDDPRAAERLAWLGTIRDDILDGEALAAALLAAMLAVRPDAVRQRFHLPQALPEGANLLEAVCRGRGFLMAGGIPDTGRAAAIVLDEFRAGRLGRMTLEAPQ